MKKFYSFCAAVVLAASVNAQAFTATFGFDGTPPAATATVTGANFTVSPFSAVGLQSTTTGNRFAWSDAPTATAPDTGKYFQVTVTPDANYKVDVNSITFRPQRSGTGPRYFVVRSSVDGYATNLPASIVPANPELEVVGSNEFHFVNDISTGQNGATVTPVMNGQATPVSFRFYFYGAEASSGTFSVDDVVISGTIDSALATSEGNILKNVLVKNSVVTNSILFAAKADVQIVNMNGQIVKSASVNENTSLDVASLAKGIYVVTGTVNGKTVSQKIVKK